MMPAEIGQELRFPAHIFSIEPADEIEALVAPAIEMLAREARHLRIADVENGIIG